MTKEKNLRRLEKIINEVANLDAEIASNQTLRSPLDMSESKEKLAALLAEQEERLKRAQLDGMIGVDDPRYVVNPRNIDCVNLKHLQKNHPGCGLCPGCRGVEWLQAVEPHHDIYKASWMLNMREGGRFSMLRTYLEANHGSFKNQMDPCAPPVWSCKALAEAAMQIEKAREEWGEEWPSPYDVKTWSLPGLQ